MIWGVKFWIQEFCQCKNMTNIRYGKIIITHVPSRTPSCKQPIADLGGYLQVIWATRFSIRGLFSLSDCCWRGVSISQSMNVSVCQAVTLYSSNGRLTYRRHISPSHIVTYRHISPSHIVVTYRHISPSHIAVTFCHISSHYTPVMDV